MNALVTVLQPFFAIIAHRAGPDVVPASRFFLVVVLAVHVCVYAAGMSLGGAEVGQVIGMPLIDMAAQTLFFALFLGLMGRSARILQTLIAAFGVDVIFNTALMPVALVMGDGTDTALPPLVSMLALAILVWSIAVKGHILQRAAGLPYVVAVLIAVGFTVGLYILGQSAFVTS